MNPCSLLIFLAKILASYPCLLELSQRTGKHFMEISWHLTSIDPILSSSFPVTFVIGKYKKKQVTIQS